MVKDSLVLIEDVIDFFVSFIENDQLGRKIKLHITKIKLHKLKQLIIIRSASECSSGFRGQRISTFRSMQSNCVII